MTIGELIVTLGFKADTVKVKDFAKAIGDLPLDVAAGIAAMAGLEYELTKVAEQAMAAAVGFQMFTSQTGLSWQELQKWQIVAVQANVSADAVASSVSNLQRQLAEISLGRGNVSPYQLLGIDPHQDAFGVLRQLRGAIQGLNPAMATNLVAQMGIDPSMMNVLHMSNVEFDKLARTVKGMSGDQEGSFLRAKQSIVQFGLQLKYLGFEVVGHLIDGLALLGDWFKRLQLWTPGLVLAFGAVAAAIFPITAAVLGLILVLDDLAVYFQGGKSITGEGMQGLTKLAKDLANSIPAMKSLNHLMAIGVAGGALFPGLIPTLAAHAMAKAATPMTQNNNFNVHSAAPAHEVAKEIKRLIDRVTGNASTQTNQQGY